MHNRIGRAAAAFGLVFFVSAHRADALPADSADDVCASNANPCTVTSPVQVADGAVLDFGTRTVDVSGSGKFDFGAGSGTILCGSFHATTSRAAILAAGRVATGGSDSGTVTIRAQRLCSSGDPQRGCVELLDCQLGACSTRRCSGNPRRTCTADSSCQVGTCSPGGRCTLFTSASCSTNADCDLGTCPEQLTCSNLAAGPRDCSQDTDCDLGTCSVGEASIALGGGIEGRSNYPAFIILDAADSVAVSGPVQLSGLEEASDGGDLRARGIAGNVSITGKIRSRSGGAGAGGFVELFAGQDVAVDALIDVAGGDFDGGIIEIVGGRDVFLRSSLEASSKDGAGYGGEIYAAAGRDLAAGNGDRRIRFSVNGHTDAFGFSGYGGVIDLDASRNATLAPATQMLGTGPAPSGIGADVYLTTGGTLDVGGQIVVKSKGKQGEGGIVAIDADEGLTVADTARIDLRGARAGTALLVSSQGTASIGGSFLLRGAGNPGQSEGILEIDACRVTLAGRLTNKATGSTSTIIAHESMQLLAGSEMTTPDGSNVLVYRTSAKPPVISGLVSPAADLVLDDTLAGCPVCGNGEIDEDETCDDGNTAGGDGCGSDCLTE